jgi:hypothetical protein
VLANIASEYGWQYTPPLYSQFVAQLYMFLAVPLALVFAGALGIFYALSRVRYAWITYVFACLMVVYTHVIAALLGAWQDWLIHPLRGPFGGMLILMPVTTVIIFLAPLARRRRGRIAA